MPSFPFRSQCTNNHIKTNKSNHTGIIVHLFNHTLLSPVVQFAIQQKKIVTLCFCAFQATCTNICLAALLSMLFTPADVLAVNHGTPSPRDHAPEHLFSAYPSCVGTAALLGKARESKRADAARS